MAVGSESPPSALSHWRSAYEITWDRVHILERRIFQMHSNVAVVRSSTAPVHDVLISLDRRYRQFTENAGIAKTYFNQQNYTDMGSEIILVVTVADIHNHYQVLYTAVMTKTASTIRNTDSYDLPHDRSYGLCMQPCIIETLSQTHIGLLAYSAWLIYTSHAPV